MSFDPPNPFDGRTEQASHATHDWSREWAVSSTVVDTIADHRGVGPIDLPPLYSHIDVDALDQLLTSYTEPPDRTGRCQVTFDYDGDVVTVSQDGSVTVRTRSVAAEQDSDEATFERALLRLVRAAAANGVDVGGTWPVHDETPSQGWRIEIVAPQ